MSAASWWPILPKKSFFESLSKLSYHVNASDGFLSSQSAGLVNPDRHRTTSDRVWQTFETDALAGMDNEKVLSLFTRGFFGGFVFSPEELILKAGGWRISPVNFTRFSHDAEENMIWNSSEIATESLSPIGTGFFGVFQLIDKCVCPVNEGNFSFVDYGFCSDKSIFAGAHRFSVKRHAPGDSGSLDLDSQGSKTTISLEGFTCNPVEDKQVIPSIGLKFHAFYARLLFANGVQSVLEARNSAPSGSVN